MTGSIMFPERSLKLIDAGSIVMVSPKPTPSTVMVKMSTKFWSGGMKSSAVFGTAMICVPATITEYPSRGGKTVTGSLIPNPSEGIGSPVIVSPGSIVKASL